MLEENGLSSMEMKGPASSTRSCFVGASSTSFAANDFSSTFEVDNRVYSIL